MKTLLEEVEATLAALDLTPADGAAAALAVEYARAIDAMDEEMRPRLLGVVGPSLLRTLEALGATPSSRGKHPAITAPVGALAALRAL